MPFKKQISQVNWFQVIAEVFLIGSSIWALAVTAGNNRWAPKEETAQIIAKMHNTMVTNKTIIESFQSNQSPTRLEWNTERAVTAREIKDIKNMLREQRNLSIEILKAINN
jgi:hypothetical protein